MGNWITNYNLSALPGEETPPQKCLSHSMNSAVIISSDLQRSIDSAQKIDSAKHIMSDRLFREAGLPYGDIGFLKLPPQYWAILFRASWLLGYSKNSESKSEAASRANSAALALIEAAKEHQSVLFVGHGIINRYIAKKLRELGWSGSGNPGSKHWDYQMYEKKT